MAAATTDKFKKVGASTVTTMSAPGKPLAATSINVGSTENYPTDTGIIIAIRTVDSSEKLVSGTYTEWAATVTSETAIAIAATPVYGDDQVYQAGSTTQVFIPTSAEAQNDLIDGILASHNQDGTLKTGIVATAMVADEAITYAKLATKLRAGWDLLSASGTRVSATQFTVTGDITDRLWVGKPVEFIDTDTKYGNITSFSYSSPNTTINLAANAEYALVGNPTNIYGGLHSSPVGFPHWFNWTPTMANVGAMTVTLNTIDYARFRINGRRLEYEISLGHTTGGSAATYVTFTLPVNAALDKVAVGHGYCNINGVVSCMALVDTDNASAYVYSYAPSSLNWFVGAGLYFKVAGGYEI